MLLFRLSAMYFSGTRRVINKNMDLDLAGFSAEVSPLSVLWLQSSYHSIRFHPWLHDQVRPL
jgi:hypothetical protein